MSKEPATLGPHDTAEIQAPSVDDWPMRSMVYMVRVREPHPAESDACHGYFIRNLSSQCTDNLLDVISDHLDDSGECLCRYVTAIPVGEWPNGDDIHESEAADLLMEAGRLERMAVDLRRWVGLEAAGAAVEPVDPVTTGALLSIGAACGAVWGWPAATIAAALTVLALLDRRFRRE